MCDFKRSSAVAPCDVKRALWDELGVRALEGALEELLELAMAGQRTQESSKVLRLLKMFAKSSMVISKLDMALLLFLSFDLPHSCPNAIMKFPPVVLQYHSKRVAKVRRICVICL